MVIRSLMAALGRGLLLGSSPIMLLAGNMCKSNANIPLPFVLGAQATRMEP